MMFYFELLNEVLRLKVGFQAIFYGNKRILKGIARVFKIKTIKTCVGNGIL